MLCDMVAAAKDPQPALAYIEPWTTQHKKKGLMLLLLNILLSQSLRYDFQVVFTSRNFAFIRASLC